jgi:hypothetical protein
MSSTVRYAKVLEILGLELGRKDMVVLGALLKAQESPSDYIEFKAIREQLVKEEGSKKGTDPLIYRSLSWLENQGFLKIDKSGHKHGYNSNISTIEKALNKIVAKKIKNLERELKNVDDQVEFLSDMDTNTVAVDMIDMIAGKSKVEKPVFVQGWDHFMNMIYDKVFNGLRRGDIIRITLEWIIEHDYMNQTTLKVTEALLEQGVDFRSIDYDKGEKIVRQNFKQIISRWRDRGFKAGYKIFPRQDATYQFVSRNSEGIALVVSEQPFSVTWVPRSSNPELVDNAIENFDRDYAAGIDILEFGE